MSAEAILPNKFAGSHSVFGLQAIYQANLAIKAPAYQASFLRLNPSCKARTPSSRYFSSTTTEIFISEVDIIKILIPSFDSISNIRLAIPAWDRMPTPTMDILTILLLPDTSRASSFSAVFRSDAIAVS